MKHIFKTTIPTYIAKKYPTLFTHAMLLMVMPGSITNKLKFQWLIPVHVLLEQLFNGYSVT